MQLQLIILETFYSLHCIWEYKHGSRYCTFSSRNDILPVERLVALDFNEI